MGDRRKSGQKEGYMEIQAILADDQAQLYVFFDERNRSFHTISQSA